MVSLLLGVVVSAEVVVTVVIEVVDELVVGGITTEMKHQWQNIVYMDLEINVWHKF